jgi:hypothetical protein
MRRALWIMAAAAAVLGWTQSGRAQTGTEGFSDPFFLYYGWYLPRQAALADQPRIQDTIQQNSAMNQAYATTNRSSLYDPNGGYGKFNPYSQNDPFGAGAGGPGARGPMMGFSMRQRGTTPSTASGRGGQHAPPAYYNRTAQFYPSARSGQGPNRNVAVAGRGVRRGFSMPSTPSMPGPR